jgi:signal transduction histidine kinase
LSIRTKLLWSYIAMIVIPLILFGISIALAGSLFFRDVMHQQAPNQTFHGRPPFETIGQWFGERDKIQAGLTFIAEYDPKMLDDSRFINDMTAKLKTYGSELTITKDSDGKPVIELNNSEPQSSFFSKFVPTIMLSLLCALILTNGLLTYLVSRSIIRPLSRLRSAAEQIREGNLEQHINLGRKDEIGQLGASFEEMRVRLKQSIGMQLQLENNRKELLANISHDLKTPITAIQGCVDCLRDGIADSDEKRDKYIGMIGKKAEDMNRLIEELFLYSTLDMKKLPFHLETIDVNRYLEQTVEELRLDPRLGGITLAYHRNSIAEAPVWIHADRQKLHRAILNVIDNSLKHMEQAEKKLDIELTEREKSVAITISDNGSGIPAESLPLIFERFYRVDNSRNTRTGGSGLGLAIVKQIVEEHGGTVSAESVLGAGTKIVILLPVMSERKGESL